MAVEMSCAELGRRVLRVGLERLAHLPYREYGRQLRWSILTWLCRELVKILGGDDQWDGFPTKGPIDAIAEFAALKREAGYKWSYFMVDENCWTRESVLYVADPGETIPQGPS